MLITDFCPSPLHWGKNFISRALFREWLLWGVLKMHNFTQLGFTDNLGLKEEDSNRNRLNTLLVCRTETINRQIIVWVMWVFFFFFQYVWRTNTGKQYREDRYNAWKSQSKKVSCSMSCNCYLTDFKTFVETKPFRSCVRRVKYNFHFTRAGCVFSYVYFLLWFACRGFNFAHELLWTTRVRQPNDLRRSKSILIILPTQGKPNHKT